MIKLVRCDDRLIHGQSMTVIVKEYKIDNIIVVDAESASNPVLKSIFKMAVPAQMTADVFSVKDAIPKIEEALNDDSSSEVLMKSPTAYAELLAAIPNLPKTLNIGPLSARAGATRVTPAIHVLPEEASAIKQAVEQGATVYFQQVPSQPRIDWEEVKDLF